MNGDDLERELDDLLAEFPKPVGELARRALELLLEVIGGAANVKVQPGWKAIQVGPGARASDMRFAILPIGSDRVNLALSHGAALEDPRGLLTAPGRASGT